MTNYRTLAVNRKARFEYEIKDTFEAGLVLLGTEIKAMREGRANLGDAYARPENGELWLINAQIAQYSASSQLNHHNPLRRRKLLLHKHEIARLSKQVTEKGLTVIPLRLYMKGRLAKIQLGLAKGKKLYDKRRVLQDREREREALQAVRRMR